MDHTPLNPHPVTYLVGDAISYLSMSPEWRSSCGERQTLGGRTQQLGLNPILQVRRSGPNSSGSCKRGNESIIGIEVTRSVKPRGVLFRTVIENV